MRILYFGTLDPNYGRNWVLINGLKKNGVEVVELYRPPGRSNIVKLFFDYIKVRPSFDVMVVGFSGQEAMFLSRILTRKPIIFDAFTSHYGGYILNRKRFSKNSFRSKYYRFLDKWSCKLANVVLLESNAYINFFVQEYNLPREKFKRVWIGANDDIFKFSLKETNSSEIFRVIFFGTYAPVQGAEYIVGAAKLLEKEKIEFVFCGKGQDGPKVRRIADELGLKNITFHGMLDRQSLYKELEKSNVSLGNFGDTPLAPLVVSNKVYEALSVGRAVITSDMPANREFFSDGEAVLIPVANSEALAAAILKLKNDPAATEKIAKFGHEKFVSLATPQALGKEIISIISQII